METYNSDGYGAYHISKFMIELNRTVALPGDFHRYILNDVADSIQNPQRTGEDPIHFFRVQISSMKPLKTWTLS